MRAAPARLLLPLIAASLFALSALAQGRAGPLPQSPPMGPVTLPGPPKAPEAPPIPPDEIIKRFTENEDAMLHARESFSYEKTIRVQEMDNNGETTGEFLIVTDATMGPDGTLSEKVVRHPPSTMTILNVVEEDTDLLKRIPLFPFTTSQAPKYNITYIGKQKLDEIDTYIFQIKPKQVERTKALFDGVIWVETGDLAVVKSTGKWITELGEVKPPQLPFTTFDSLRENVAAKEWFPAYMRSDTDIPTKNSDVHLRLTVLWQDYKSSSSPAQPNH